MVIACRHTLLPGHAGQEPYVSVYRAGMAADVRLGRLATVLAKACSLIEVVDIDGKEVRRRIEEQ